MVTTDALQFIKARLPKGSKHRIRKSTGFTISYINLVLNGERFNDRIIEQAIQLIEESSAGNQEIYDRLNRVAARTKQMV